MNIQLIKKAQQETIAKRNRANKITFIAGTYFLVYGLIFAFIMPGIEAIILGSFITIFGVFIFSFSVAAKQNNK
jgi:hypothetical protein